MPKSMINALTRDSWKTMREAGGIKTKLTGPSVGEKVEEYIKAKAGLYNFLNQNSKQIRATYSPNNPNLKQDLEKLKPGYELLGKLCTALTNLIDALRTMKRRTEAEIAKLRPARPPQYLEDFDANIGKMITEGDTKLTKWKDAKRTWENARAEKVLDILTTLT
jgi:hypothetical protein